jgi:hypothetical protein
MRGQPKRAHRTLIRPFGAPSPGGEGLAATGFFDRGTLCSLARGDPPGQVAAGRKSLADFSKSIAMSYTKKRGELGNLSCQVCRSRFAVRTRLDQEPGNVPECPISSKISLENYKEG